MMERIEPEIKSSDDTISTPAIATSTAIVTVTGAAVDTVTYAVTDTDADTVTGADDTHAPTSLKDMSIEDLIREIKRELAGIRQIVSELEH